MFPAEHRYRLEGDDLFRDGLFVDQVERVRFERAYRVAGSPRGALVADLGAFPGTGLLYFGFDPETGSFSRNRYIAVGNSDDVLRRKVESAGHRVHQADFEASGDLGISDADVIFAMEVIEHIRRPHAFLGRVCSQMKNGSRLYLTTNNSFYSGYIIKLLLHRPVLDPLATEGTFYPGHCRYYSAPELAQALTELGLQVEIARTFHFGPPISAYRNRLFGSIKAVTARALAAGYPSHVEIVAHKPRGHSPAASDPP